MSRMDVSGLCKSYNSNTVLEDINVAFESGRISALVGHNGAGKSTLLRMLAGVERPDAGEIVIDNKTVKFMSPKEAYDNGIACVYQELRTIDHLTVADNMFLGQEPKRGMFLNRTAMWESATNILSKYGLDIPPDIKVRQLSHAQKQLLEIISALQRDAKFLFLDEPTTSLEYHQIDLFLRTIRRIADEQNVGIILVTHKLNEVYRVSDYIHVLCDGKLVLSGPVAETPRTEVVQFVVGQGPGTKSPSGHTVATVKSPEKRDEVEDGPLNALPVLEVSNLNTQFVHNISVAVRPGQIIGIYGLVGSGRTEFLRALYGLDNLLSGQILIDGKPFVPKSPAYAISRGVAFLTEDRRVNGFVPELDCIANAALPVYSRYSRGGFVQSKKLRRLVSQELQALKVRGNINGPMKFLSGGNQQKILFARASLQDPKILLLDEPTKGIDIGVKDEIYQIIRHWAQTKGTGIIVVSTEEEEILKVSDEVMVFAGGTCHTGLISARGLTATDLRNLAVGEGLLS